MSFERNMIGLTTAITNLQLTTRLEGYENGTTPFERDAVLRDLKQAITNAVTLNSELLAVATAAK